MPEPGFALPRKVRVPANLPKGPETAISIFSQSNSVAKGRRLPPPV
jgi:hypothetical protein